MNFKTTGLLVGLLVIVGVIWLFFPHKQAAEPGAATAPPPTEELKSVFDPQPRDDEIARVEIERPGQPRMVFERVPSDGAPKASNEWNMVEPLTVPADGNKVMGLVRSLSSLQYRARFEPGAGGQLSAAEAGLEPPQATICFIDKESKPYKLEIGKKAVMSSDTYVRLAGSGSILVTTRDLRPQWDKSVKDYRATQLVRFKPDEAVRLQIEHEGKTYEFSRSPEGDWVIDAPVRAYADRTRIRDKLLTPLSTLHAAEFLDQTSESPAVYGLDEPFLTIAVTTEKKRQVTAQQETEAGEDAQTQPAEPKYETATECYRLTIGGFADLKSERRYAAIEQVPGLAVVQQSTVNNLIPKLNELRDPRVTRLKAADINAVQLTVGEATVDLKKINGQWQSGGELAALEIEAVNDLIDALANLSAINYVDQPEDPAQYGLDQPRAVLTVTATGLVTPITLRVGNQTASGRNQYIQREGDPTVLVVSQAQAARLAVDPLTLRSREVFTFPQEQLSRLEVQRGTIRYVLVRQAGEWKFSEPPDAPVEIGAVQALVNDLSRLRGSKVAAKNADARYGLDEPAVTIQMELIEAGQTEPPAESVEPAVQGHVLRVTLKDNKPYARKDDDPYIYELDETVYRVMTAELIDTRLFTFKPEEVTAVRIAAPGGTLELLRQGEVWKYGPDPFVELSQKKVQDFVRDLAQMRAESYLAYRNGDLAAAGLLDPPASVTLRLVSGQELVIHMTPARPGELPRRAALVADQRIFLMRQADCEKLLRGLDQYLESGQPGKPAPSTADEPDED